MYGPTEEWPPRRDAFFRDATPHRPIFQGDIFRDVPYLKALGGDRFDAGPKIRCERRVVAALTHPCEMYARGVMARSQTVALVREATKVGATIDGRVVFSACPLLDLFADGTMWAADFLTIGNVDRSYLTMQNRIACLTEVGWVYLRQRLAVYFTRVSVHLDDLRQAGRTTWDEMEMWERWNALGRQPSLFQPWLDQIDRNIGFTRRQALDRGMRNLVGSSLVDLG